MGWPFVLQRHRRPFGCDVWDTMGLLRYRHAALRRLAAKSSAARSAMARAWVNRFAPAASGPASACLMTSSHIAAEKARNTAASSGIYSHVQVIASTSINGAECVDVALAVSLQPAGPGSDGPQVSCRTGSECVPARVAVPTDCAPNPGPHLQYASPPP